MSNALRIFFDVIQASLLPAKYSNNDNSLFPHIFQLYDDFQSINY